MIHPLIARATRALASLSAVCLIVVALPLSGCGGSGSDGGQNTASGSAASPVAAGSHLYQVDGCAGCHSLNGTRTVGPSWAGLAGSEVHLSNGRTVKADDAYLTRHIVEPNAMTVEGYPGEVMAQAIQSLDLRAHPDDVKDLVAFIDSLR